MRARTRVDVMDGIARLLMLTGGALFALGALVWLSELAFGDFRLGRLPGDIHIERENGSVYIPITTMLLLSFLGSGLMALFRWWKS